MEASATKRIEELKKALQIIESILDVNPDWNSRQRQIAKYVFCVTMMQTTTEITYQVCLMGSRDVVDEINNTIGLLTPLTNLSKE